MKIISNRLEIKYKLLCFLIFFTGVQPAFAQPLITTFPDNNNSNLALAGQGNTSEYIVKIATLAISQIGTNGFTLTVNSGKLTKANGQTPISFQVTTVTTGSGAPTAASFSTSAENNYTLSTNSNSLDLYIKYTPLPLQDPGNYSHNLTLQVVDN
jgi:hypothetical protein